MRGNQNEYWGGTQYSVVMQIPGTHYTIFIASCADKGKSEQGLEFNIRLLCRFLELSTIIISILILLCRCLAEQFSVVMQVQYYVMQMSG